SAGARASNSACPAEYVRDGKLPALYRTNTPRAVRSAGGPPSTSQESKNPARGDSTFTARPSGPSSGVQASRLSEVAISRSGTPKYIQYLPFTRVAMIRSPATRLRIAPDFDSVRRYLPPATFANAGPCLVQWMRSRDVATARRGTSRFHCVYVRTYVPSSVSTMRGSSTPPGHSFRRCASLSGYNTGVARRVKCRPSVLSARPSRDVCPPISWLPVASAARYSSNLLPSFTTTAGSNVA